MLTVHHKAVGQKGLMSMCTGVRFTSTDGDMYFGRNLDWTQGYGERLLVVPADAQIPAAFVRPHDAKNGHAVIGVGIMAAGVPLYFDCGNDAGLAIAGLNFPQSARYAEAPRDGSVNVAAYEFPYWVARNFSSVAQVRAALAHVEIVGRAVSEHLPVASLHWMIADAVESIVVECMEDGMHIWDDHVDVLTNEPDFSWQLTNVRNYLMLSASEPSSARWGSAELVPFGSGMGLQGMPGDYSGPSRFVKAAFVNTHFPNQVGERANVGRLFKTLGAVAVPEGCARMADGSFERTLYTSCFSASTLTYYYAAYGDLEVRSCSLGSLDLSGGAPLFADEL